MGYKLPFRSMPFSSKIYVKLISYHSKDYTYGVFFYWLPWTLSLTMRFFSAVWSIPVSLNLRGYPWFMSGSKHAHHLHPAGLQASLPYLLVYLSIKFVFISSKVVCPCCGSDTKLPTFNPILHWGTKRPWCWWLVSIFLTF